MAERGRHQATKEKLALADVESASTRKETESAKNALNLAIENFRESQEYKDEILESGFASYYVGYENGRDAVRKLYPDLDLSSIVSLVREKRLPKRRLLRRLREMHQLHQNLLQPPKLYRSELKKKPTGDRCNVSLFFVIGPWVQFCNLFFNA